MLDKTTLIRNIQQLNRSAAQSWLDGFDDSALRHYLEHLQKTVEPRGGQSFWVRRADTSATITRGRRS